MSQSPLDYRSSEPPQREPAAATFSLGMALPVALFVGVLSIILLFVIPRLETVFKDFGTQLPLATTVVLNTSRWFRSSVILWGIALSLPILAGLLAPKSKSARRWLRLLMVLAFAGIVLLLALAVMMPLFSLIDNMKSPKR